MPLIEFKVHFNGQDIVLDFKEPVKEVKLNRSDAIRLGQHLINQAQKLARFKPSK